MSKSAIFAANTTAQDVAINGYVSLGNIIRRFGCAVNMIASGAAATSISLLDSGYYKVDVSATVVPTAAGTVTLTLFQDGVAIPGAEASATVAAAATSVSLSFPSIVRVFCNVAPSSLSLVLSGTDSSVENVAVTVVKE